MSRTRQSDVRLLAFVVPLLCLAQTPTIGVVELYGARKIPVSKLRQIAAIAPGAKLPASKDVIENQLLRIAGVRDVSVEAACCDAGRIILYVGVAEEGVETPAFREDPSDGPDIPEEVTAAYRRFLDEVNNATRAGVTGEDLGQGHSLMTYAPAREAQQKFVEVSRQFLTELKAVLRTSASEDHRAMAAYVLGYYEDKKQVIEDLVYGLRDGDSTVRGNAMRALAAIATYAQRHPEAGILVEPLPFAEMLNSVVWTDRNNAAVALVSMTESRDAAILALLREHSLPSLVEMARWKHEPHALPAYILLGRSAGIAEPELQTAWSNGQRERIIARASSRPATPAKKQSAPPDRP